MTFKTAYYKKEAEGEKIEKGLMPVAGGKKSISRNQKVKEPLSKRGKVQIREELHVPQSFSENVTKLLD